MIRNFKYGNSAVSIEHEVDKETGLENIIDEPASAKGGATFSPLSQTPIWHLMELSRNITFCSIF